jgi:transposase, IS5 family
MTRQTEFLPAIFEVPGMRKTAITQLRFDTVPIHKVPLNLECRDSIIPILKALQHVYAERELTTRILGLIAADINPETRTDTGRDGLDYWQICALSAVRLGCNVTYDQLQDLGENHRTLRAMMGLGAGWQKFGVAMGFELRRFCSAEARL